MKTDKDLMYIHSDIYSEVYKANPFFSEDLNNNLVCPSCDFKVFYKKHTSSIEVAFSKVIAHMLDTHKKEQ
jgi:DNA-directed RNA polymerase subunit RPC12/RpoP